MSYQALYRAWRPNTFSQIIDQDAVVRTLRRQVETGHIGHAYLFCGSRGTGKTSAAKVFARAINCLHPAEGDPCGECEICRAIQSETCMDVMEIDAASNNSVDEIRDLREKVRFQPAMARYKVYIIDEVHMLSQSAFNALLKTLEEPPSHAVFILATTEPHKLLPTVLSRCQRFDFHRISVKAIVSHLHTVLSGIGREAGEDALNEIARAAEGAMRDALSLLDVCLSFTDGIVTAELTRDVLGTAGRDFMFDFVNAVIAYDAATALTLLDASMRRGSDPCRFAQDAALHIRNVLLGKIVGEDLEQLAELTHEDTLRFIEQGKNAGEDQLTRDMDLFMRVDGDTKYSTQTRSVVELAIVRACHPEQEADASLNERMAKMEKMLASGKIVASAPATVTPAVKQEKPAEKKTVPAAPAEKPPEEYAAAMEKFGEMVPSTRKMLSKVIFGGFDGSTVTLLFDGTRRMIKPLLERNMAKMEEAFTQSFGVPVKVRMLDMDRGIAPTLGQTAKRVIEQSYDVFGRDKVELTE